MPQTTTALELFHVLSLTLLAISFLLIIVAKIAPSLSESMGELEGYAKTIFPVLLVIVVVRTYTFEPFNIPSESMFPQLTQGDVVLVYKSSYSIKFPLTNTSLVDIRDPKRGEVAVFKYPINPHVYFIKRIIGVPGDVLVWKGDSLFVNGHKIQRIDIQGAESQAARIGERYSWEMNGDRKYKIRRLSDDDSKRFDQTSTFLKMRTDQLFASKGIGLDEHRDYLQIAIPEGYFFVMGDNRDESSDSRDWGLVSRDNFVGEAKIMLMNISPDVPFYKLLSKIRFDRSKLVE